MTTEGSAAMGGEKEINGYDVYENETVTPAPEPEPPAQEEE